MNYTELPLIDYIEPLDEKVTIYIYTKDKRIIVLEDVRSNMSLYSDGVHVHHMLFGKRMTFMMPREDFSHVEYYTQPRPHTEKQSQVDDEMTYEYPSDLLSEPYEVLYEDLI